MDQLAAAEDLQFFTIKKLMKEAVKIPITSSPRKFFLITLTLILPLSIAQLFIVDHHVILLNFFSYLVDNPSSLKTSKPLILGALIYEFFYVIIFLFTFSLLCTSAVVFTVASLYASKPVSFIPTLLAIPRIFKCLFITFLYVLPLIIFANFATFLFFVVLEVLYIKIQNMFFFWFFGIVGAVIHDFGHLYIWALWHMANVVSVLEQDVFGLAAMKKSKQLLKGKTEMAFYYAGLYMVVAWSILEIMDLLLYMGDDHHHGYKWVIRVLVGSLCVIILVVLNLFGLLVQSVFYYVCKSYHHQVIDKRVLYDHLSGYLGEQCEPLTNSKPTTSTGSIEMKNFGKDYDMAGNDVEIQGTYVAPTSNSGDK